MLYIFLDKLFEMASNKVKYGYAYLTIELIHVDW